MHQRRLSSSAVLLMAIPQSETRFDGMLEQLKYLEV